MTLEDLALKLAHLDPGSTLVIEESLLTQVFPPCEGDRPSPEIEEFATAHRCRFHCGDMTHTPPHFEKEDVF